MSNAVPEQAVAPTETDWVHACNAIVGTKEYYKHIQSSKGAMESLDLIERCLRYAADFIHTQPLVGVQWRPIESAPKDGTKIILYHEKWDTFPVAFWEWGEGPDEDGTGGWCAWHTVDDRFSGAEDGIIYPSENHMPTHWQPLSAAPASPRAEDEICAACGERKREHAPGGTRWGPTSLCGVFIPADSPHKEEEVRVILENHGQQSHYYGRLVSIEPYVAEKRGEK